MDKRWLRGLVIAIAFLAAVGAAYIFAHRAGRAVRQIHAAHEPIRPWMTIPFIAHTHHVPESALFQAIGVEPRGPHDRRSVRRLAHELHRPVPQLMAQLERAIAQNQGGPGQ